MRWFEVSLLFYEVSVCGLPFVADTVDALPILLGPLNHFSILWTVSNFQYLHLYVSGFFFFFSCNSAKSSATLLKALPSISTSQPQLNTAVALRKKSGCKISLLSLGLPPLLHVGPIDFRALVVHCFQNLKKKKLYFIQLFKVLIESIAVKLHKLFGKGRASVLYFIYLFRFKRYSWVYSWIDESEIQMIVLSSKYKFENCQCVDAI